MRIAEMIRSESFHGVISQSQRLILLADQNQNLGEMARNSILNYKGMYSDLYVPALSIGGSFVLVALILSIILIFQHLRSYTNPAEQKWIVAVVFMVPVYAIESILSLWNSRLSIACDILRNCYEAFALYSFGSYLVACLGGEARVVELLEYESRKHLTEPLLEEDKRNALQNRSFTSFFLHPSELGENLYRIVKFGLVQYMILKTLCAFLALLLELFGVYGDGEFKWYYGYPYIAAVLNFSQMWALYCLVQFYNMTHQRLQPIKPLAKFISFKAIVFATWWQGVGIAMLCQVGALPKHGRFKNGLQDFLICIEMAIAAVAHVFVFSAKPYHFLTAPEHGKVTPLESKAELRLRVDDKKKAAAVEQIETRVETPGTSVSESVQDIFFTGGEHVVKDVVLTLNKAMEPVEKGVTKIQEKFHHHVSVDSDNKTEGPGLEVEHVEENLFESGSQLVRSEEKVITHDETDR